MSVQFNLKLYSFSQLSVNCTSMSVRHGPYIARPSVRPRELHTSQLGEWLAPLPTYLLTYLHTMDHTWTIYSTTFGSISWAAHLAIGRLASSTTYLLTYLHTYNKNSLLVYILVRDGLFGFVERRGGNSCHIFLSLPTEVHTCWVTSRNWNSSWKHSFHFLYFMLFCCISTELQTTLNEKIALQDATMRGSFLSS